jgi:ParB family transcriptional regulator, chromosome partitioning protein
VTATTVSRETFGGLLRDGETAAQALARLERTKGYGKVIESDEGQRLLAAAAGEARTARNGRAKKPAGEAAVEPPVVEAPRPRASELAMAAAAPELARLRTIAAPASKAKRRPSADTPSAQPAPATAATFEFPNVSGRILEIAVDELEIADNVRAELGELEEMAASIRQVGVLQPIKVALDAATGGWRVVYGHRRVAAAKLAGLERIPAIATTDAMLAVPSARRSIEQLVENLQRADLNPIDEARAIKATLEAEPSLTQAELAKRLGRSAPWLANTLRLLQTDAKVQDLLAEGKVTAAHAKVLVGLPAADQVRLANSAAQGSSAHAIEDQAKWIRSQAADERKRDKASEDAGARAVAKLDELGTPKDVPLYVYADDWRVRDEAVRDAVAAAGYAVQREGWPVTGTARWSKCDCTALELRVRDGKGSVVETACASTAHREAQEAERRAAMQERSKAEQAERRALHNAITAALEAAPPHATIVRLLLRELDGYSGKAWSEYAKLDDHAALRSLAERIAVRHGTAYGKPAPIASIVKALGGEAAKPAGKSGRKAAAKAAAAKLEVDEDDRDGVDPADPDNSAGDGPLVEPGFPATDAEAEVQAPATAEEAQAS